MTFLGFLRPGCSLGVATCFGCSTMTPRRDCDPGRGQPVDAVLGHLEPLLESGDIVIDGGNSWFLDTRRREKQYSEAGLHFFGVGVSGGEEGARYGHARR